MRLPHPGRADRNPGPTHRDWPSRPADHAHNWDGSAPGVPKGHRITAMLDGTVATRSGQLLGEVPCLGKLRLLYE
jgi:hypothetical protein